MHTMCRRLGWQTDAQALICTLISHPDTARVAGAVAQYVSLPDSPSPAASPGTARATHSGTLDSDAWTRINPASESGLPQQPIRHDLHRDVTLTRRARGPRGMVLKNAGPSWIIQPADPASWAGTG